MLMLFLHQLPSSPGHSTPACIQHYAVSVHNSYSHTQHSWQWSPGVSQAHHSIAQAATWLAGKCMVLGSVFTLFIQMNQRRADAVNVNIHVCRFGCMVEQSMGNTWCCSKLDSGDDATAGRGTAHQALGPRRDKRLIGQQHSLSIHQWVHHDHDQVPCRAQLQWCSQREYTPSSPACQLAHVRGSSLTGLSYRIVASRRY